MFCCIGKTRIEVIATRGTAVRIILFKLDFHKMLHADDNNLVVRVKIDNAGEIEVSERKS